MNETVKVDATSLSPRGEGQDGRAGPERSVPSAHISSFATQEAGEPVEFLRHIHRPLPHDSAFKHVQGVAQYIDDIREPDGTLHVAIGQSPKARGRLVALDLRAVREQPGVVTVLTAR